MKNLGVLTSYATADANHSHAVTTYGSNTYGYDADGQQATRTVGGASTTLSWDPLHHLYRSVDAGGTTKYVNATDGSRIARLDPDGSTTIWVAGNELHVANGVATDTRYYGIGGATIGQRNSSGLTWLMSDGQNSRQVAVNAATGAVTRTYYTPYGAQRAGAPALPTDQNFLGRVLDGSGLLQDGARYYDPSVGQFVSPDPELGAADNQSLNPYSYGRNSPETFTDPSGRSFLGEQGYDAPAQSYPMNGDPPPTALGHFVGDVGHVVKAALGDVLDLGADAINGVKDAIQSIIDIPQNVTNWFVDIVNTSAKLSNGGFENTFGGGIVPAPQWTPPNLHTPHIPDVPTPAPFHGPKIIRHIVRKLAGVGTGIAVGAVLGPEGGAAAADEAGASFAAQESVQLFRNVDATELGSIADTGKFATGDGMMEGKWFATTGEHAEQWGTKLNGGDGLTVETRIPQSVADQLHYEGGKLDGVGPAWFTDSRGLDLINRSMDGIRVWP